MITRNMVLVLLALGSLSTVYTSDATKRYLTEDDKEKLKDVIADIDEAIENVTDVKNEKKEGTNLRKHLYTVETKLSTTKNMVSNLTTEEETGAIFTR